MAHSGVSGNEYQMAHSGVSGRYFKRNIQRSHKKTYFWVSKQSFKQHTQGSHKRPSKAGNTRKGTFSLIREYQKAHSGVLQKITKKYMKGSHKQVPCANQYASYKKAPKGTFMVSQDGRKEC